MSCILSSQLLVFQTTLRHWVSIHIILSATLFHWSCYLLHSIQHLNHCFSTHITIRFTTNKHTRTHGKPLSSTAGSQIPSKWGDRQTWRTAECTQYVNKQSHTSRTFSRQLILYFWQAINRYSISLGDSFHQLYLPHFSSSQFRRTTQAKIWTEILRLHLYF